MDYKEKYEKALERMKSWANGEHPECFSEAQKAAEFIFPELAESEDEKIRKEVEKAAEDWYRENYEWENPQGKALMISAYIDGAIAWLEKQGELKLPIEKLPSEMKTIGESLGFTTQEDCDKYNQMVTDLIMSDDDKGEQKSAWSEEDKKQLERAIYMMEQLNMTKSWDDVYNWLKSLKPQPHWKPTEEQIYALCQTSKNDYLMYNKTLKSLYNDLKKL